MISEITFTLEGLVEATIWKFEVEELESDCRTDLEDILQEESKWIVEGVHSQSVWSLRNFISASKSTVFDTRQRPVVANYYDLEPYKPQILHILRSDHFFSKLCLTVFNKLHVPSIVGSLFFLYFFTGGSSMNPHRVSCSIWCYCPLQ